MAHEESTTSVSDRTRPSEYNSLDLLVCAVIALLNATLIYIDIVPVAIRIVLGVPLLFFLPGYVLVSTLFPRAEWSRRRGQRPTYIPIDLTIGERFAISFASSVALIPLLGLLMGIVGLPLTTSTILGVLSGLTIVGVIAADLIRLRVPKSDRYYLPVRRWIAQAQPDGGRRSKSELIVTIVLVASIIVAMATFGYALGVPQQGERYTDFYVLDDDGETYAEHIVPGQSNDQTLVIHNREGEMEYYTIVVTVQTLDQSNSIVEERELRRFGAWVFDGERYTRDVDPTPDEGDGTSRVVYYLFKGDAPQSVTSDSAYRWLSVEIIDGQSQQMNETVQSSTTEVESDTSSDSRISGGTPDDNETTENQLTDGTSNNSSVNESSSGPDQNSGTEQNETQGSSENGSDENTGDASSGSDTDGGGGADGNSTDDSTDDPDSDAGSESDSDTGGSEGDNESDSDGNESEEDSTGTLVGVSLSDG